MELEYQIIKIIHITAIISWLAAMLYLPRLFVYHLSSEIGSPVSEQLLIMEKRLAGIIMDPAALISWITGLLLAVNGHWFASGNIWLHIKILMVILLTITHVYFRIILKKLRNDWRGTKPLSMRFINEIPTIIMIIIISLVIIKPF